MGLRARPTAAPMWTRSMPKSRAVRWRAICCKSSAADLSGGSNVWIYWSADFRYLCILALVVYLVIWVVRSSNVLAVDPAGRTVIQIIIRVLMDGKILVLIVLWVQMLTFGGGYAGFQSPFDSDEPEAASCRPKPFHPQICRGC